MAFVIRHVRMRLLKASMIRKNDYSRADLFHWEPSLMLSDKTGNLSFLFVAECSHVRTGYLKTVLLFSFLALLVSSRVFYSSIKL